MRPALDPAGHRVSNEAYLSSPHLEDSSATTFHACSSPAPTRVKPQPAPAILRQESVHTTLSITHHTRKRPSTGPRTTHGPHYNKKVKVKQFAERDLVWKALLPIGTEYSTFDKWSPNWEGPFRVVRCTPGKRIHFENFTRRRVHCCYKRKILEEILS
jgi:hypothetical protein